MMPVPWHDVATKDDLRVLSAELRAELHTEIGGVRAEIGGLRAELHTEIGGVRAEIGGLRAELHTEIGGLRGEIGGLRGELHQAIVVQTRWLMGYVTALSAVMLTVARLLS
jgi:uncharacterized small protein (DUF1192 family)